MFDARAIDALRSVSADVCSDTHATLAEVHRENSLSTLSFPLKDGACRAGGQRNAWLPADSIVVR